MDMMLLFMEIILLYIFLFAVQPQKMKDNKLNNNDKMDLSNTVIFFYRQVGHEFFLEACLLVDILNNHGYTNDHMLHIEPVIYWKIVSFYFFYMLSVAFSCLARLPPAFSFASERYTGTLRRNASVTGQLQRLVSHSSEP